MQKESLTHFMLKENEKSGEKRIKHVYNETIQPPEINAQEFSKGPGVYSDIFTHM